MGRATITAGGAAGSYTVRLDTGKATQTAQLARLDARLAALVPLLATAQGNLSVAFVLEQVAEAAVQVQIDAYVAATRLVPVDAAAVKTALSAYTTAATKLQEEKRLLAMEQNKVDLLLTEQAQLQKDRATWAALVLEQTQQAWCSDLTEDASGEVATIELPDEPGLVLIAPAAPVPTEADGVVTAREVQSGPQVFWNAAVLPGLQRWRPAYRRGTITALNVAADLADVTLDAASSSAQALPVNASVIFGAVPVRYMNCNATAFEVGDKCVVKFLNRDWAQPQVVGFVDNPKACEAPDIHLIFWQPGYTGNVRDMVMSKSTGGVHQSGAIVTSGHYSTLGLTLATRRQHTGVELTDVSESVSYELLAFYDNKPVLLRRERDQTSSSSIGPAATPVGGYLEDETVVTTTTTLTKISFGKTPLLDGSRVMTVTSVYQIFQPPYVASPNTRGELMTLREALTLANYSSVWAPSEDDPPAQSIVKVFPPWASWSLMITYVTTGYGEYFKPSPDGVFETVVPLPDPVFTAFSLGAPKKNTPPKPLADVAQLPAHTLLEVPRVFTLAQMAATPLDRHALDFGYLPYKIADHKIRAVGKTYAYAWLEGEGGVDYFGPPPFIQRANYKTGAATYHYLNDWFEPLRLVETDPLPLDYIPKNIVLLDDYMVCAENDLTGPYFWLKVFEPATGVMRRITNKPGYLGAGFEGVIQIATPKVPEGSYLIGAMRDEVACM